MDSVSSIASLSTMLSNQALSNQIQIALLKQAQHAQKTQGNDVLKLMQSALPSPSSINVYA